MKFRVVIAGCRWYDSFEEAEKFLDACLWHLMQRYSIVVLSGAARGADYLGERYAAARGLIVERHPARWERYKRGAGHVRNEEMAELSDLVICFWDGKSRGTKSMIDCAKRNGKQVIIKSISQAVEKGADRKNAKQRQ